MTAGAGQSPPTDPLRAGIAAAKAGQRAEARALLQKAVERDDKNVTAWLWLSGVIDELDNRAACLEHVLELDPENEAARRGLEQVRRQRVDELLRSGLEAAKKGQRDHARKLLMQVVELDEKNLTAWLWLSGLVASLDDRQVCLENVLALDPNNEAARRGLEQVQEHRAAIAPQPVTVYESPATSSRLEATTFAVDVPATHDDLSGECLCPYCATETEPEAKTCPQCGGSLVVKTRRREDHSIAWWILFCLQALDAISALFAIGLLFILLRVLTSPEMAQNVTSSFALVAQRYSVIVLIGAMILQLVPIVVFIGLILRWQPIFWFFVAQAALSLVVTVAIAMSSARGVGDLVVGGIPAILSFGSLLLVFQAQDDFAFDYHRIWFRTDKECKTATDFFAHAGRYSRQNMWALAALHLERAVGLRPDAVEGHLALSSAYMKLKRFERAIEEIEAVRKVSPDDPRVAEQVELLEKARSAAVAPALEGRVGEENGA